MVNSASHKDFTEVTWGPQRKLNSSETDIQGEDRIPCTYTDRSGEGETRTTYTEEVKG